MANLRPVVFYLSLSCTSLRACYSAIAKRSPRRSHDHNLRNNSRIFVSSLPHLRK